jgi:hypothetical protein
LTSLSHQDPAFQGYAGVDKTVVVDKVEMPIGIEKMIGFVGLLETSGFYMHYMEVLVNMLVRLLLLWL